LGKKIDTLDIVCHSMGYAYALGMIDVLKDSVTFGRFYIIAPENAESGGTDWNVFTEVWQYGSDEETLKNTPKLQDGVAPQTKAKDLPKDRRVFIPYDVPQGFLKSHSIGNYKWIFTKLTPTGTNSAGYVKPRN